MNLLYDYINQRKSLIDFFQMIMKIHIMFLKFHFGLLHLNAQIYLVHMNALLIYMYESLFDSNEISNRLVLKP